MRPSWNGHLRLSLVSCPIGLVPATTEVERIKLNQLQSRDRQSDLASAGRILETGEEGRACSVEIVKGYKLEGDQYFILEPAELKELQVGKLAPHPGSRDRLVDRASVDPIYIDAPCRIYPEKTGPRPIASSPKPWPRRRRRPSGAS